MIRAVLIAAAIVLLGNEFAERVRLQQERHILERLPVSEASAYYDELRARIRKVKIMRGLVLVALVILVFSFKAIFMGDPEPEAP